MSLADEPRTSPAVLPDLADAPSWKDLARGYATMAAAYHQALLKSQWETERANHERNLVQQQLQVANEKFDRLTDTVAALSTRIEQIGDCIDQMAQLVLGRKTMSPPEPTSYPPPDMAEATEETPGEGT